MEGPESPIADLCAGWLAGGNALRLRAHGDSMLPFLRHGDVVLVQPTPAEVIAVGDVVCYQPCPGRLLVHRVVRRSGARVIVKGDAVRWIDTVCLHAVLGRVVAVERHGRLRRLDARTARWVGRFAALVSPVVPRLLAFALRARAHASAIACRAG